MYEKEIQVSNGEKKRKRKFLLIKQKGKGKIQSIQNKKHQKNNGCKRVE